MTPATQRGFDIIKWVATIFVAGAAWASMTAAIDKKADERELQAHIVQETQRHDSLATTANDIANFLCVDQRNPFKRLQLRCDQRGIK